LDVELIVFIHQQGESANHVVVTAGVFLLRCSAFGLVVVVVAVATFALVVAVAAAAAAFSLVVTALLHLFSISLWRFFRHLLLALFSEVLRRSLSLSLSLYVSLSLCLCDPVFPTLTASVSRYVWNFERCKRFRQCERLSD
jgi:hypothetical protein